MQVEVEIGHALLAAQLLEQARFACPVRAGDEEEAVVLGREDGEDGMELDELGGYSWHFAFDG